jgi:hypothetical protein
MVRTTTLRFRQGSIPAIAGAVLVLALLGCNSAFNDGFDPTDKTDSLATIPISSRNSHLPIEIQGEYGFRHIDFNGNSDGTVLPSGYQLHIEKKADGIYGWSFNADTEGLLLKRKTVAPIESSGIYIVGSFSGDSLNLGQEELWLPQILTGERKTWEASGRRMTLVSLDTVLWLPKGISTRSRVEDPYTGRLRVEASLIREEKQGLTTYYAFAEGIGLVAYEQKVGDVLLASGTLELCMALFGEAQQIWP